MNSTFTWWMCVCIKLLMMTGIFFLDNASLSKQYAIQHGTSNVSPNAVQFMTTYTKRCLKVYKFIMINKLTTYKYYSVTSALHSRKLWKKCKTPVVSLWTSFTIFKTFIMYIVKRTSDVQNFLMVAANSTKYTMFEMFLRTSRTN